MTAAHLKFLADADIDLTDLWSGEASRFRGEKAFALAPRQTLIFTARGTRRLADGIFLSEQPGKVNPAVDGVVVPEEEPFVYRPIFWAGTRGGGERPRYGGWGGAQADSTPYGLELAVAGRRFDTGIGILANSRLEVRNPGHKRFTAMVGVDDSARDRSEAVVFEVHAGGRLLARSRPMRFGEPPVALTADVKGQELVELVARTAHKLRFPDPVTWGDAALTG